MKTVWSIISVVMIGVGILWFIQGVGVLAGSFMTGQTQWAIYGAVAILVGAGLLLYVNRREAR